MMLKFLSNNFLRFYNIEVQTSLGRFIKKSISKLRLNNLEIKFKQLLNSDNPQWAFIFKPKNKIDKSEFRLIDRKIISDEFVKYGTKNRSTRFFATKQDLIDIMVEVEQIYPLEYIPLGLFDSCDEFRRYSTISQIEGLGISASGFNLDNQILVVAKGKTINYTKHNQRNGGVKYYIEPGANTESIQFLGMGGQYKYQPNTLVHGTVVMMGYAFIPEFAMELYKQVRKRILKKSKRVENMYVAPEALSLLKAGWRLTTNAQLNNRPYNDTMLPEQREADMKNRREVYDELTALVSKLNK